MAYHRVTASRANSRRAHVAHIRALTLHYHRPLPVYRARAERTMEEIDKLRQ